MPGPGQEFVQGKAPRATVRGKLDLGIECHQAGNAVPGRRGRAQIAADGAAGLNLHAADLAGGGLQPVIGGGQIRAQDVGPAGGGAEPAPALDSRDAAQLVEAGDVEKRPVEGRCLVKRVDIGAAGHHKGAFGREPVKGVFQSMWSQI